jgi:hypothetical protein
MNKLLPFTLVILCLLSILAFVSFDYVQSVVVGVSKGDTFLYNASYLWSSTNPNQAVPADAVEANQTREIQFDVTSVSGSVINASKTYRYQNGTSYSVTGYADVASGDNEEIGAFFFVSSNLTINDLVYPSGLYGDTVNQTLQREYAGKEREVILDSSTFNFEYNTTVDGNPTMQVLNSQIDYYFDKQTGVCVEQREQTAITDPNTGQSETSVSFIQLTQTNLWGGSALSEASYPIFAVIAVVAAFAFLAIAIVAILRKRQGASKHQATSN